MNAKKIFWIILFTIVVLGAGYGLYYNFFKAAFKPEVPVTNTPTTGAGGVLPSAGEGGAKGAVKPSTPLPGGQPLTGGAVTPAPSGPAPSVVSQIANGGVTVATPVVASPTAGAAVIANGNHKY